MDGWEAAFVQNMVRERLRLGMSQTELARRVQQRGLACHQQTIARIENGSRSLRLNEAQELAAILFDGSWDVAIEPVGSDGFKELLRQNIERSVMDRSELYLLLTRWIDVGDRDLLSIAYALGRYQKSTGIEEVDDDAGLVEAAENEIRAWQRFDSVAKEVDNSYGQYPEEA